jgi:hypothetical protein
VLHRVRASGAQGKAQPPAPRPGSAGRPRR